MESHKLQNDDTTNDDSGNHITDALSLPFERQDSREKADKRSHEERSNDSADSNGCANLAPAHMGKSAQQYPKRYTDEIT